MRRLLRAASFMLAALVLTAPPTAAQPALSGPIVISAQDAGACATANACAGFAIAGQNGLALDISGTFSATLTFEGSVDEHIWRTITVTNLADLTTATTTTTGGTFAVSNAGLGFVRVRAGTLASGSATVYARRGYASAKGGSSGSGAPFTVTAASLATTSTDGLVLANPTLATALVTVQQSPRLRFRANVWNTTVTAANNTSDFWVENVPTSGAFPFAFLKFLYSANGGAAVESFSVSSGGNIAVPGEMALGAAAFAYWTGRAVLASPADAHLSLTNNAVSAGVRLDVATDAVMKVRTRAGTADATVQAKFHPTEFLFANIATTLTANGDLGYCTDCTIANPCAGGGTGAIAKRLNGVNVCN